MSPKCLWCNYLPFTFTFFSFHPPSVGRFVTRRRRAIPTKSKPHKKQVGVLNSSDEFSSSRILRPTRRRKVPPTFMTSSAENSVNDAGTISLATNPLREISLNESSDHSLGPCSRKPIFCSTPSAGSFTKRPHLKPFATNNQSSMSVSCIGILSPFQENVNSAGQPIASPSSAPPSGLHSNEKQHSGHGKQEVVLHNHEEPTGDLFMEFKNTNTKISCSEDTNSHSKDPKTISSGELPRLNLLSTDSESSSYFVTAAGGLEWLIEALKEKCLTEHCTVQLERLDILSVTHLCSQTTYSSCLGDECSVQSQQTNQHPVSVYSGQSVDLLQSSDASFNLGLSATDNDYSLSVNKQTAPLSDSQNSNISLSIDCKQSVTEYSPTREFITQSTSVLYDESTNNTNSNTEVSMSTELTASSSAQMVLTEEETATIKDKGCAKKCKVQLKKMSLSHLNVEQLKGFTLQKESRLTRGDRSVKSNAKKSANGYMHNADNPDDIVSASLSVNNISAVAQVQSNEPVTEKPVVCTSILKEKCLTNKLTVDIKRLTLSKLKDDHIRSDHQSGSDTRHCNEDTSSRKANIRKRTLTSSEDKISSDVQEVVKRSRDVLPKRKKKTSLTSKEKKRRDTSTDRPGTTRKACVSGMSVSRWKNNSSASTSIFRNRVAQAGSAKAVDCSINELISMQHKQPRVRALRTQTTFID